MILYSLIFLKTTTATKALHSKSLFSSYFMSSVSFFLRDQSVVAAELSGHSSSDYYTPYSWLLVISGIGFFTVIVLSLWVRALAKWLKCQCRLVAAVLGFMLSSEEITGMVCQRSEMCFKLWGICGGFCSGAADSEEIYPEQWGLMQQHALQFLLYFLLIFC